MQPIDSGGLKKPPLFYIMIQGLWECEADRRLRHKEAVAHRSGVF